MDAPSSLAPQTVAKLVLLGEMGSGKSSLVLRYCKGQFYDFQASLIARVALHLPSLVSPCSSPLVDYNKFARFNKKNLSLENLMPCMGTFSLFRPRP